MDGDHSLNARWQSGLDVLLAAFVGACAVGLLFVLGAFLAGLTAGA
jgi:hypothetical protein